MLPNIVQDLLKIVGGGGMMIIVLAITLQWINIIPDEEVMSFIVWALGCSVISTLVGLLSKRSD